jgi:serine phosphatase RsbU (regulator of sigma subunit)
MDAPALIGEIGVLTGAKRTATIRAAGPIEILRVGREAFLRCAQDAPDLLVRVIAQLGRQIQNINQALGFFSAGLDALERDDFDPAIMDALNSPTPELMTFAEAFQGLAKRVINERKTRGEMTSAAIIQRAMLPNPLAPEALGGKAIAFGDMKPARNVGGDLYDLFLMEDGRLAMVIGDVCGKGVPASLFMSVTVTALRVAAQSTQSLEELVARANATLCAHNDAAMFSTLFYGALDLDTGRFEYVNCGHNPPLLFDANGASVELEGRGPPLGLFPEKRWSARTAQVAPGGGVLLYTDGVTEAVDPKGAEFGDVRLAALVASATRADAQGLVQTIIAEVDVFAAGGEQFDDITCVAAVRF